ncbi:hypothetical protein ACTSKR_02320 [Chitinibacteraceae bacterium HSL-7]
MTITAVSGSSWANQLTSATQRSERPAPPEGMPPGPPPGGGLSNDISDVLSEMGLDVSGLDSEEGQAALSAFMQSLMDSTRAQSQGSSEPPSLQADLQSLISSLASGSGDGSSDLEQSFNALVQQLGGDSADLGSFLQALSSKVPADPGSGQMIRTSA